MIHLGWYSTSHSAYVATLTESYGQSMDSYIFKFYVVKGDFLVLGSDGGGNFLTFLEST